MNPHPYPLAARTLTLLLALTVSLMACSEADDGVAEPAGGDVEIAAADGADGAGDLGKAVDAVEVVDTLEPGDGPGDLETADEASGEVPPDGPADVPTLDEGTPSEDVSPLDGGMDGEVMGDIVEPPEVSDVGPETGDGATEDGDGGPGFTVDVQQTDTAIPLGDGGDPMDGGDTTEDTAVPTPDADGGVQDVPQGDGGQSAGLWLLTIDNNSHTLKKVDVATAATTDVCQLNTAQVYPSLTFSRFNGLYGSMGGTTLHQIDPCTCAITPVGAYGAYSGVYGITADKNDNLFGVATTQDWLISVSTASGQGTGVGALGFDFTTSGGTWSDLDQTVFAISGGDDGLYSVDPTLGTATLLGTLDYDFGTVGIELHPANGVIYACSSEAHLLAVDLSGQVHDIGDMNQTGSCTNLAAPWLAIPCLENL
jgi:hypothetical protein